MQSIANLYKLNEQIASGRRINKPSDDVTGAARALDYKVFMENGNQYLGSINSTMNALSYADSTLTSVNTSLVRLKELSIIAASDSTSDASRYAIATETKQLREHVLSLANTKIGGVYIFSGFKTDTPAYDNSFAYQGDSGLIKVGVGGGMDVVQNITGAETFSYTSANKTVEVRSGVYAHYSSISDPTGNRVRVDFRDSGGNPLSPDESFEVRNIIDIAGEITDAIENNKMAKISACMTLIDDMADHVNKVRAELGTRMNGLESQDVRIRDLNHMTAINLSSIEDADIISTASDFAKASNVLSAVHLSTARILSQSLLDFLR